MRSSDIYVTARREVREQVITYRSSVMTACAQNDTADTIIRPNHTCVGAVTSSEVPSSAIVASSSCRHSNVKRQEVTKKGAMTKHSP
jgi:hypothetical protein